VISGSLVIEVVACPTTEEMRRAYLAADRRADVVELRLDALKDLERISRIDRLLEARGKPKLVTVRSRQQGGAAPQPARGPLLRRALAAGAEYLDLEFDDRDLPLLKGGGRARRVLSHHDLSGTPSDLPVLEARMRAVAGGALLKIVTLADASGDNLRVRDLLRSAPRGSLISFCAGPKGLPSRILAPLWGSAAIYAPLRQAPATAPGQVPLEDLFELYGLERIAARTRLLGVLGSPVSHSISPLIHNAALRALDLDFVYLPFEATTVGEFLPLASELRVQGLSVTLPHKERILPYLDRLDDVARGVGAVNTVVKVWNRLEGYNTDVEAALAPLRRRLRLRGARAAVMGAGGAARALLYGLRREGCRVTLFNRTASRGRALARALGARHLPWPRLRRFRCDLLINATPVGMAPAADQTPVPASWVVAPIVYDIIYNPPETLLLRQARKRGAEVIDGTEMFVAQAEAQFRLFTGRDAPPDVMRKTLLRALAGPGKKRAGRS
jgi:3-dehydroquinate dehydratase/shikimate dehydrogenase